MSIQNPKSKIQNPSAFDAFAESYDDDFTHSRLGQLLRSRVWQVLADHFRPGEHVLELACGTGEDAVWLAQHGRRVTATDGSPKMLQQTNAKAQKVGLNDQITTALLPLQELTNPLHSLHPLLPSSFEGVFSNFGGLSTIGDWRPLATTLAQLIRPGGKAIFVPMGPFCPWEIGWYLLHGQPRTAFRRFGRSAPARIGNATIPIYYPSARRLRRDFAPWFRHIQTQSLGLWLPPSYLEHLVKRWAGLFGRLNRLEQRTAPLTKGWGDHYIIILERNTF